MEISQDEARKNAYDMGMKDLKSANEHTTEIIRQLFSISTILLLFVGSVFVVMPQLTKGIASKLCIFIIAMGSSISMITGIVTLQYNREYLIKSAMNKFEMFASGVPEKNSPPLSLWFYFFTRTQTASTFMAVVTLIVLVGLILFS